MELYNFFFFGNWVYSITFCRHKSFSHQYIALFLVGLMWDSRGTYFLRGTHFSMTRFMCSVSKIVFSEHMRLQDWTVFKTGSMKTVYVSVEKEETPSPPLNAKRLDFATSASRMCSLTDLTHSSSDGNSDDNDLPSDTSSWSLNLIDKFGIRKVLTDPFELVRYEWSLCNLTDDEVFRIDEIVKICSLPCIDFYSLEEIPFENSKLYKQWVQEWFPKTTVKELKL